MRALILGTVLVAAPATAQVQTIVEPVPDYRPVMLPIERDENGVVKAQYIKPGDLSPEDYQALLDEAARIQAYQGNAQPSYTYSGAAATASTSPAPTQTANIAPPTQRTHTVVKGDTLYNIAKRNNTSVDALKSANNIGGSGIQLGQTLLIPSVAQTVVEPVANSAVSAHTTTGTVLQASQPAIADVVVAKPYAVLPGDTLYGIARRACVGLDALKSANALSDNAIKPGQRLTLPGNHCLN